MSGIEVIICKGGREIDRVRRPLRESAEGPAVTYRRQLWPLKNGTVNLDEPPVKRQNGSAEADVPAADGPDLAQRSIISRPVSARLLVDAGPGTGKTHVACERVVALIAQGIAPSRIWLISFTRTAVLEIRSRIASALRDPADAAAVCIATLDSHAWALQSGFSSDARLTGSFDENIEATVGKLQSDEELREYLATRVKHLIIDEGQDIIGIRAELSLALIRAVAEDCGVTVFADEAQAIYGFSEEEELYAPQGPTFTERLRNEGFEQISLSRIYRTSRPNLSHIFTGLRQKVLGRSGSPRTRRAEIEAGIRANADKACGSLTSSTLEGMPESGLILARRRVDVLLFSSMQAAIPHRLRLSGLPSCLRPWIAYLLWDWTVPLLTRQQFEQRWNERGTSSQPGSPASADAWRLLVEVAGRSATAVDLARLREVLGRPSPPMLFCAPEFGYSGPIIGTIHASKGREADHVALYLPRVRENQEGMARDTEEEIRVLFVGATRARKFLSVGDAPALWASERNARVWREVRPAGGRRRIQVEVGRVHDLTAEGLAGRRGFARAEDALAAQSTWRSAPVQQNLSARAEREVEWDFVLENAGRARLAVLGRQLRSDLRDIARDRGRWPPPGFIPHLRSLGVRTLVLPPGDPHAQLLHEPWRSSGFLSAPLLIGFSVCNLGDSAWSSG